MPAPGERGAPTLKVSDWYIVPQADQIARRREVWGLLGWYHRTQVEPYLGIRGSLRKLWNRLRGKAAENLSIWDRLQLTALLMQREQERQAAEAARAAEKPAEEPEPTA